MNLPFHLPCLTLPPRQSPTNLFQSHRLSITHPQIGLNQTTPQSLWNQTHHLSHLHHHLNLNLKLLPHHGKIRPHLAIMVRVIASQQHSQTAKSALVSPYYKTSLAEPTTMIRLIPAVDTVPPARSKHPSHSRKKKKKKVGWATTLPTPNQSTSRLNPNHPSPPHPPLHFTHPTTSTNVDRPSLLPSHLPNQNPIGKAPLIYTTIIDTPAFPWPLKCLGSPKCPIRPHTAPPANTRRRPHPYRIQDPASSPHTASLFPSINETSPPSPRRRCTPKDPNSHPRALHFPTHPFWPSQPALL